MQIILHLVNNWLKMPYLSSVSLSGTAYVQPGICNKYEKT
jgi:hypothetical protein